MVKIILVALSFMLYGCGTPEEEVVEPYTPIEEIELVEMKKSIEESFLESKNEALESMLKDETTSEMLIDSQRQSIAVSEQNIESSDFEIESLKNTIIYNDIFKVINNNGVFIDVQESIFTKDTFVHGFSRSMSEILSDYKEEFTGDAIFIAAVPFGNNEDKTPIIGVKYNANTLKNIDIAKLIEDEEYFYKNADIIWRHSELKAELSESNAHVEDELLMEYYWDTY